MNILAIIPLLTPILERLIPDQTARAKAQDEIAQALIANQTALATTSAQVMAADSASESWLTRNVRPITALWGLVAMSVVILEAMTGSSMNAVNALKAVPSDLWNLVLVLNGGYLVAKTAENIVRTTRGS